MAKICLTTIDFYYILIRLFDFGMMQEVTCFTREFLRTRVRCDLCD